MTAGYVHLLSITYLPEQAALATECRVGFGKQWTNARSVHLQASESSTLLRRQGSPPDRTGTSLPPSTAASAPSHPPPQSERQLPGSNQAVISHQVWWHPLCDKFYASWYHSKDEKGADRCHAVYLLELNLCNLVALHCYPHGRVDKQQGASRTGMWVACFCAIIHLQNRQQEQALAQCSCLLMWQYGAGTDCNPPSPQSGGCPEAITSPSVAGTSSDRISSEATAMPAL